jgi:hypothetical protein
MPNGNAVAGCFARRSGQSSVSRITDGKADNARAPTGIFAS